MTNPVKNQIETWPTTNKPTHRCTPYNLFKFTSKAWDRHLDCDVHASVR
ncbi:MAG: hypothetical protein INH37_09175 [Myxococcaceae bacterium]|nr:hypothetical protein [Myxococcaceae bacterium]